MSLLQKYEVKTGQLISSAEFQAVIKTLDGDHVINPQIPPMLEDGGSGGSLSNATSYTYSYTYISWTIRNGVFDILRESAESGTASLTPTNSKITVWYAPPSNGDANGVIIYRSDAGDTRAAVKIILDVTSDSYTDGLAGASRGRNAPSVSLFDISQPFTGSGQMGRHLPLGFIPDPNRLITKQITSGSSFTFTRTEDFLLFSVAYPQTAADTQPFTVQTINSSHTIWANEQVTGGSSAVFGHPVPIPYSEGGIKVSGSTFYVLGAYTGIKRSYSKETGTAKCFSALLEGPVSSPRYQWSCPVGMRAIIVHASNTGVTATNPLGTAKMCQMVVTSDSVTRKLNSKTTYAGTSWRLPGARMSSPSSMYAGGMYGNWNRGSVSPFMQPVILEQGESITTVENEQANIFGYLIDE